MDIKDLIDLSLVLFIKHPSDKVHLLDHLARRRVAMALDLPYEIIFDAFVKREALGSTGTGKGVAFPHARLPSIGKPLCILARLNRAIDFDAIDGEPVDIVCLMALPPDLETGQHALACAARVLRDKDVLLKLRMASDPTEAYRALVPPGRSKDPDLDQSARRRDDLGSPACGSPQPPPRSIGTLN
jgi:nitrogen PTS system EIIA component